MRSWIYTVGIIAIIFAAAVVGGIFSAHPAGESVTRDSANHDWPMFQGNARHTGLSPYDTSANDGTLLWDYNYSEVDDSSPQLYTPVVGNNGTIYVGVYDPLGMDNTTLLALNSRGELLWRTSVGNGTQTAPAIGSDGTIYVNTYDGLYALSPNGAKIWKFRFTDDSAADSPPTVAADGTIYVLNSTGLVAITHEGARKWFYPLYHTFDVTVAVGDDGTVYVGTAESGSDKGGLLAIDPDGNLKWKYTIPNNNVEVYTPVVADDGTIYATANVEGAYTQIYALNPSGDVKWVYPENETGEVYSIPSLDSSGNLYFYTMDGVVVSVNSNGHERWNTSLEKNIYSIAVGYDGTVYVASTDSSGNAVISALSTTGLLRWENVIGKSSSLSYMAINENATIYISSTDGNGYLYAVGPSSQIPEIGVMLLVPILLMAIAAIRRKP